jgi:hypothetical protein
MAGFQCGLQAGAMVEGEQHIVDRRTIGHDLVSLARRGWRTAVFSRNRHSLNSPGGGEAVGGGKAGLVRNQRQPSPGNAL